MVLVLARDHPAFHLCSLPHLLRIHNQQVSGRRSDEGIELLEVVTTTYTEELQHITHKERLIRLIKVGGRQTDGGRDVTTYVE